MIYHNILQTLFTSLIPLILNLAKIPWTFSFYIIYVIVQWLSTFTIHVNFPQSQSGRLVLQEGDWVKKSVIWGVDLSYEWKCRVELAFILFRHFSGQFEVWCNSMESCCHVAFIYHLDTLMPSICLLKFPIDNWQKLTTETGLHKCYIDTLTCSGGSGLWLKIGTPPLRSGDFTYMNGFHMLIIVMCKSIVCVIPKN